MLRWPQLRTTLKITATAKVTSTTKVTTPIASTAKVTSTPKPSPILTSTLKPSDSQYINTKADHPSRYINTKAATPPVTSAPKPSTPPVTATPKSSNHPVTSMLKPSTPTIDRRRHDLSGAVSHRQAGRFLLCLPQLPLCHQAGRSRRRLSPLKSRPLRRPIRLLRYPHTRRLPHHPLGLIHQLIRLFLRLHQHTPHLPLLLPGRLFPHTCPLRHLVLRGTRV
ncbi:uncharacterized protein EV422DRAFT_274072 [Fimicolochytrium jonesii]|uniref:uncharacterized protein n=1 Tax=Fimicolochytrium jonesii TaxID=1396493 RepID=UPI0022FDEB32|nr:uncharacterized protein EV422DRAFT_274072 [Fimicolochytrium jonesii]KAI8816892.1 hypothetical protein EV422DRAFT_274072 [Fimicolochytrium jonesii]